MTLPVLSILYGSATGNAEHIAKDLSKKVPKSDSFYSSVLCIEADKFKRKCQKEWEVDPQATEATCLKHPVIIVTSTTGNGDPPENAGRFVRYLKRKGTADSMPFKHCAYAVLSLGDTNYDQFCATGKIVDKKLHELGGTRAKKNGTADEATGLEEVVEPWIATVMADLRKACLATENSAADEVLEEEKKEENHDITTETDVITEGIATNLQLNEEKNEKQNPSTLGGLSLVMEIAKEKLNITDSCLPTPPASSLPSMHTSMSSCTLLCEATKDEIQLHHPQDDRASVISGSSSSYTCHYTKNNPYSSSILNARYLTQETSLEPASKASALLGKSTDKLSEAVDFFGNGFDVTNNVKDGKRVIELTLGLPDDYSYEYEPGDSIGIMVSNEYTASFSSVINMLKNAHGMDVNKQLVSVDDAEPISVYEAISTCIDITSVVKKRILAKLSQVTDDENESKALQLMASKSQEGETLYKEFVEKYVLNYGHILELFPSCKPTLEDILGMCDSMVPRYYSVCSSPMTAVDRLSIAFSVVDYCAETHPFLSGISQRRRGLATQYLELLSAPFLANCKESSSLDLKISVFPKPSIDFRLPKSSTVPLILIGPGTGVAPFIGFIEHRQHLLEQKKLLDAQAEQGVWRGGFEISDEAEEKESGSGNDLSSSKSTKTVLFFGCKWPTHDYLFKNELEEFVKKGSLTSLHTAFSRAENQEKQYVQHIMKTVGKDIVDMICNENAAVYVCGDGNAMGRDVQACLVELLDKYGDFPNSDSDASESHGQKYLNDMKKRNKFLLDIWS